MGVTCRDFLAGSVGAAALAALAGCTSTHSGTGQQRRHGQFRQHGRCRREVQHRQGDRHPDVRVLGRQHGRNRRLQLRQAEVRGGQPGRHRQPEGRALRRLLLRHRPRHHLRHGSGHLPRRLHHHRQVQRQGLAARHDALLQQRRGVGEFLPALWEAIKYNGNAVRSAAPDRHDLHRLQQGRLSPRPASPRCRTSSATPGRGTSSARSRTSFAASLPPRSSRSPTTGPRPARSAGSVGCIRPAAPCSLPT